MIHKKLPHKLPVLMALLSGLLISSHPGPSAATTTEERCLNYARSALDQQVINEHAQCNYSGLRWSKDFTGQQNWCRGVRPAISQAETSARAGLLNACFAAKADAQNRRDPLTLLPGACRYNPEKYQQLRYFYTRQYYNSKPEPTAPVNGDRPGLIDQDFDGDGKHDYLFLERSPAHKFRILLCMSSPAGWKRHTLYTLEEDVYPGFSSESQSVGGVKGGFSYTSNYFEHNAGSRSSTDTYSYYPQHKAFLLDKREFSSYTGDGMTANSSDKLDYVKGLAYATVDCSALAPDFRDGCVSKTNEAKPIEAKYLTLENRRLMLR